MSDVKTISSQIKELTLSLPQLADVREVMAERLREGLAAPDRELAALPTYLPPPGEEIVGEALVVDIGGTNVRASRLKLKAGKVSFPSGEETAPVKSNWESAADFFHYQASLLFGMKASSELPVGYCFSYPAHPLPDRDAVLLRWTKDLSVPGVVGRRVGKMLQEAFIDKGIPAGRIAVSNDTVAALMGGAWTYGPAGEFSDFIGLIVGTGHNMASFFPGELISPRKLDGSYRIDRMAVNLESGNFHPPHLSFFDDELDDLRRDAGAQRLEKAVSGKFLPELYGFIVGGRAASPGPETSELFRLAYRSPRSPEGALALAIVNRSADLVAASLAGLIEVLEPSGQVGVLAEGSVIIENPEYHKRVEEKLIALLGSDRGKNPPVKLFQLKKVNLIGAAIAALTP